MKWFIRIFISLGLLFFGGGSLMMLWLEYGWPWQHGHKQQVMETYLEDKYKDTFTFDGLRFDFMHGRNYYTYATAASTGASFYVEVSPENTVEDSYSYEYWNEEIQGLFKPLLTETLGQYERVDGEVFLAKSMDIRMFEPDAASFVIYVAMGSFLEEENLDEQLARWFAAIEAIRAAELSVERLVIRYYDKDIYLNRAELREVQSADQLRRFFNS
ncbi:MAG: hypothetical protein ABS948_08370 [Solibacillus sp.]